MKHTKALGVAAVAAMALIALLGAGSASATVLCKTNLTTGCATSGEDYVVNTAFEAIMEGTMPIEVGSTVLQTCTGSRIFGESENTGKASETVDISVANTDFTWEGCNRKFETIEGGTFEIHHATGVAGTDATVTAKEFEFTVQSSFFPACIFGFGAESEDFGKITSGNPATLKITAELPLISGSPCPPSTVWTAAYNITKPTPLFIAES